MMDDIGFDIWRRTMYFFNKYWGCHQMATRSFFFKGFQFPLCARCTGILVGEIVACLLLLCNIHIDVFIAVLLICPTVLDGMIQLLGKYESTNFKRLFSGLIAGIGLIFILAHVIHYLLICLGGE